ncbi:MAG TPA: DUF1236 domain-containing protein [Pseudolabrys sp.]|nr:DUF1236 domain-containing protein [Pseudolabrys sp.]
MRKAKLLSTVAAALLLTAGAASAQMTKETPERAPAAQQNAPAEKMAPSLKDQQKSPQTTGQATPDSKSTTGQAPKSDADQKAQAPARSMDKDSKPGAATGKSDANGASKTEQKAQSPSGTEQNRTTTGQGAAGSAKLTTEQRTKISSVIKSQKVESVRLNVSVSVGTRIPADVRLHSLPQEVIVIYPEWRGYDYILVGDQIVIVNPRTHEIVAIVEA